MAVDMTLGRRFWDQTTRQRQDCEVRVSAVGPDAVLEVSIEGEGVRAFRGYDFEDALQSARADFESLGRLLLVNRFRQDAFVSPMSRQMSNGLSCYLVEPRRSVDPSKLVNCLDPTDERSVVTEAEAREFIARWQSQPLWGVRLRWLGWFKSRCD